MYLRDAEEPRDLRHWPRAQASIILLCFIGSPRNGRLLLFETSIPSKAIIIMSLLALSGIRNDLTCFCSVTFL